MIEPFSSLSSLKPYKREWRVKVRVISISKNMSDVVAGNVNSIDLILLDCENNKMQATVPYHLIRHFSNQIQENGIYVIYYFRVIHNSKGSRFGQNKQRILLCRQTEIYPSQSFSIDPYGFSLMCASELFSRKCDLNILVDTIGVLVTYHFDVLEFSPRSNIPVVKFEIADQSGRFACALMGKYVNEFREYLSNSPSKHPVVILQFAKISFERGYPCLENYKEVTRVMFNASIREVLSNAGGVNSIIYGNQRKSLVVSDITPFDSFYPHKSVREFIETPESGFFVLCARVVGIFHLNKFWYPACKCGKFLDIHAGCYFCDKCNIHIYSVSSMFKLQIGIDDGTSTVLIQTTYSPLRGIHSLNHSSLGMEHALSHYGSKAFEGKEVLLIVRKFARSEYRFEDHVEIINMTDEEGSILRFHELGSDFTPTKSISSTSFTEFQMDYNKRETISSAIQTVVNGKKPLIESNSPNHLPFLTVGTITKSRSKKAKKRLLSSFYEVAGECSYMNSK